MWSAATVVIQVELATWGLSRRSVTIASMNGPAKPGRVAMIRLISSWSNCSRPSPVTSAPMPSAPVAVSGLLKAEIPPVPFSDASWKLRWQCCTKNVGELDRSRSSIARASLVRGACGRTAAPALPPVAASARPWPTPTATSTPAAVAAAVDTNPRRVTAVSVDAMMLRSLPVTSPARGGPGAHYGRARHASASGKKDTVGLYPANMGLHHVVTLTPEGCVLLDVARLRPGGAPTPTIPSGRARAGAPAAVGQSPISARTLAAWPSALTLYQARSMRPSGPTRKVERITPTLVLPYRVFSPQAPYASIARWSRSDSNGKRSPYFSWNLRWLFASSGEIPTTGTPARSNAPRLSLNWQASAVQPGVSSLG